VPGVMVAVKVFEPPQPMRDVVVFIEPATVSPENRPVTSCMGSTIWPKVEPPRPLVRGPGLRRPRAVQSEFDGCLRRLRKLAERPLGCGAGYEDGTTMGSLSISWSRSLGKPVGGLRR
jgi:hypothetical protein